MVGVIVRLALSQRKANRKIGWCAFATWVRLLVSSTRPDGTLARALHLGLMRRQPMTELAAAELRGWDHGKTSTTVGGDRDRPDVRSMGTFDGFKSGILLLLGAWIAYFVVVELFIRTLDRIIVPVLGVPLSALLVAQGSALLFLGALYVLARGGRAAE
jgi:hypothetical protein